jgi:outer membrane protein OmpA-like peptidoglycan-associated protein
MLNKPKILIILLLLAGSINLTSAQTDKIHWYSFEEAVKLNNEKPKKMFMDVFTDWCGWCKVLDKSTFPNPVIVENINKYFYAVKLNAERKDTVWFNGYPYINPTPDGNRSTHQLAAAILKGRMAYPSMVFFNDSIQILHVIQSYLKPSQLEPWLVFIGEEKFKTMTYDSFQLAYKVKAQDDWAELAKPVVMHTLTFDAGKTVLKETTYTQLDSVVNVLKTSPAMNIEIDGYTDNTGDAAANKTISEQRAKAVYDYILAKGIEAARLSYVGYGQLNPIADNATIEGQKLNRRIEIKVK